MRPDEMVRALAAPSGRWTSFGLDLSQTRFILSRTISKRREPIRVKLLMSTALAALAGAFLSAPAMAQVTVAVVGPQSGPLASFGAMMAAGAGRAAQAINARGGVRGETVEVVVRDDVGDPARARTVAGGLAAEGVAAVIGHLTAGPSLE